MQAVKQLGGGLLLGFISLAVVIGGILLALAEGYVPQSANFLASETPGDTPYSTSDIATSFDFLLTAFPTDTPAPSFTPVPPTNCPPPSGWALISVGAGDTIESIAAQYRTTIEALVQANCLISTSLLPGYTLYVPPLPTSTVLACGAPAGWIQYTVQSGDTLFKISQLYRTTVLQLQQANCLGSSSTIFAGQKLWVPNVSTSTPAITATIITIEFATATPEPSATPQPTNTVEPSATPVPPTVTPPPTETAPPSAP
jgi:LysM repeat protein